ncbi:MAG: hypothetical protein ACLQKA_16805 [Bryobacteraceae bacterium]
MLNEAEAAWLEVLVTADKNLSCQQNLAGHKIAVVDLGKGRRSRIRRRVG